MPNIDIRRPHNRSVKDAKAAVDRVAKKIAKEFGLDCRWEGDTLAFSRSGVDGHIAVEKKDLHVHAKLGFLLGAMKPLIEREIERHLDDNLV